jgi:hypothetical protein
VIPESGHDFNALHAFVEKEFDDVTLLDFHPVETRQPLCELVAA